MTQNKPVEAGDRNLSGWDFFLLWAGAAIALTEIWAGGLITKQGLVWGVSRPSCWAMSSAPSRCPRAA